ncbi:MAG TPA: hypothetical protein VFS58_07745 [Steroidobacteraceae bacterium]|nr:hypothetical protein [Steroidobacteraceae bacterium]
MFVSEIRGHLFRIVALTSILFGGVALAPTASASMLVLEQSGLITGVQTTVTPFTVSGAGTLRVTLTDMAWPDRLATLSFAFSDAGSVLGQLAAPGTQLFQMSGAAQLFAHVYGRGAGDLNTGLYSLRVEFTPVPLPSAAILLLTGMGLFAALRRPALRQLAPATC